MSTTVMGQKLHMPLFCAPTALQRLFHHDGEMAVAKAAEKFGTMFCISSLGTISIEEIGSTISTPKLFQLYFHKDRGLTNSMIERCIAAKFRRAGADRRHDHGRKPGTRLADRLHFTTAFDAQKPPQLRHAPEMGGQLFHAREFRAASAEGLRERGFVHSVSIGDYFSTMLDESMNWQDAEDLRKKWGKQFCLKGIMSVADAKRAVDIGATGIMVSNHGGRQLDGSAAPSISSPRSLMLSATE